MEYTIQSRYLSVRISDRGAELQSIQDREGTEYLWQGDEKTWPDRALNIFPYVARLTEKKYRYRGQTYRMEPHGFLPYTVLNVVRQTENELVLELHSGEETNRQYPFAFTYRIGYRIEAKKLEIKYTVENQDTKPMYFGIGGHPGFQAPLEKELAFEDYSLVFQNPAKPVRIGMSEDCFVTGETLPYQLEDGISIPLQHDMFDQDAIILKQMDRTVRLESKKGKKSITVSFPKMDYLGIWHWPKAQVNYVCIEPWSSLPSREGMIEELEQQADLVCLPAGEAYQNQWSIRVEDGRERDDV